ncbi:putative palmitoyltransferase pfa4 protein [Phaeoacremonium minimum UCRPA7]|uniref:Palmitoyltransferase n=1 Tax=Phaeoacremonium minimum (strain UCR-PA7) TaxID=1286976 RepID=R8BV60_PHAM7|nr:putative palmitoyltransferase pfa4 protein [Phaeoacremonium minimum UCRPA7]EOO03238.1 putative palmitoyltransferase pfa4 protein [Phaeoacremonium minimum UCRPA7]
MDHHCPWTNNCVSLQTFPYFLRFLVWTNTSLWTLSYFLFQRAHAIWDNRNLPAYLGPSLGALIHLTMLGLCCAAVSLALGILLFTTAKGWALNTTMIEGWEVERHEAVLARYNRNSWFESSTPDPAEGMRFERVEFPYDVGFYTNMTQAMGTANPLAWFSPFAGGPTVAPGGKGTGWDWPENGYNPHEGMWPPLDPEKIRRAAKAGWPGAAARQAQELGGKEWGSPEEERAAFRARQEQDLQRRQAQRSGIVAELEEMDDYDVVDEEEGYDDEDDFYEQGMDGEPGWTNSDGDRLRDYGVDEDAEDEDDIVPVQSVDPDEDDVPLAELIRRRKAVTRDDDE